MALIILATLGGYMYLRQSLPQIDGELKLAGLEHPVSVVRDKNAIPHIYAETKSDLYTAIGFVHAQDRLWQMEMNRRTAAGRLSEVLGEDALNTDKFLRTLGVYERARQSWDGLDADTKTMMTAYAKGVNAFIDTNTKPLPPEFLMLGHTPEPWSEIDSLSWLKMMAWDLGGNWRKEITRLKLLSRMTPEQIQEFYPPFRGDASIPLPDVTALYDGATFDKNNSPIAIEEKAPGLGSNNWVISGRLTKSGKPLLANDPHLGLSSPSLWYFVHMSVGGKNVVGVSMPSLPFITLGRNDNVAWGFTNTGPDVQDMYLERTNADNPDLYDTPDGVQSFHIRREVIHVKGAEPVVLDVRESRHGPIISDVMDDVKAILPENLSLAFRWTALDSDDTTPNAARQLLDVANWDQFITAMAQFAAPEQNIVYADTAGNIGYFAPAKVPVRKATNDAMGLIPVPGWKAAYDWGPYIAVEDLPRTFNPEQGYIATANAKIVNDDYPHHITTGWAPPYRTDRINQLIENRVPHSIESMGRIQMDVRSKMAESNLPYLLPMIEKSHPEIAGALSIWTRNMDKDAPEPLIFMAWHHKLTWAIYGDEVGDDMQNLHTNRPTFTHNVIADKDGQSRWCDDIRTDDVEDCATIAQHALNMAMDELSDDLGQNWKKWRWSDKHYARNTHMPFTNAPYLRGLFDQVVDVTGGPYTVNVTKTEPNRDDPLEARNGASYRALYDLSDLEKSRYIIPTGQSGNLVSPWYSTFTDKWATGAYIAIPTDKSEVMKEAIGELTLVPND